VGQGSQLAWIGQRTSRFAPFSGDCFVLMVARRAEGPSRISVKVKKCCQRGHGFSSSSLYLFEPTRKPLADARGSVILPEGSGQLLTISTARSLALRDGGFSRTSCSLGVTGFFVRITAWPVRFSSRKLSFTLRSSSD